MAEKAGVGKGSLARKGTKPRAMGIVRMKSKLSAKGQITLPKGIRDALGVRPGEEVIFEVVEGQVILKARRPIPLDDLFASLRSPVPYPGEEAEKKARALAWAQAWARKNS